MSEVTAHKNNPSTQPRPAVGKQSSVLAPVVDELYAIATGSGESGSIPHSKTLPSRDVVIDLVESLRSVLFPGYFGLSNLNPVNLHYNIGSTLDHIQHTLQEQIKRALCFACQEETDHCPTCHDRAVDITPAFIARLPAIRKLLTCDLEAAYEGDPAATSHEEAIFCYPGMRAITDYRLAHELHLLGVPLIPRMITEHAHSVTGIDIHPGATIGEGVFIDHGTGVVIGETGVIGRHVRLYQGVTLGARSFPLDKKGKPIKGLARHPVIEDDVVIYAGATILGRIEVGRRSIIGGNVWLTRSVPPHSRITQVAARREIFEGGAGI